MKLTLIENETIHIEIPGKCTIRIINRDWSDTLELAEMAGDYDARYDHPDKDDNSVHVVVIGEQDKITIPYTYLEKDGMDVENFEPRSRISVEVKPIEEEE